MSLWDDESTPIIFDLPRASGTSGNTNHKYAVLDVAMWSRVVPRTEIAQGLRIGPST